MRKLYSFLSTAFVAFVLLSTAGRSYAQLFNYVPYPFISINEEDYYPGTDPKYLVPDALPGGERIFLVPVFFFNGVNVAKNPNTVGQVPKTDAQRNPGVDGQFLEPIRSFEFQLTYANQAIVLDEGTVRGTPIVMTGPSNTTSLDLAKGSSFYTSYSEQSANDINNPYLRRVRVVGASEVPLPLSDPQKDTNDILCFLRFRILPNWIVNATILQLDSAKFADHRGDPQYDPNNWQRGNLAGHASEFRGRLRVEITAQPAIELRPVSEVPTNDNVNFTLTKVLISDPADPNASSLSTSVQLRDGIGNTRLTNIFITTDQNWLNVGKTNGPGAHTTFIPKIDYTSSNGSEEVALWISANPAGLLPGVYHGYVTITSDGAGNSPARILVTFIVRASPDEPTVGGAGTGIHLTLTNACNPSCSNSLVFGTGAGATDGIDELYGEDIFTQTQRAARESNPNVSQRCWAVFEPLDPSVDIRFQDPNFAGILRDIRANTADTTILYLVRFNATGSQSCYPVTVCMDPNDFPAGSRIIVRDVLNGSRFSYNMREATSLGSQRCVTIQDANINSFVIEYTRGSTGTVATLLQNNWNFISLPVLPPDGKADVIFPNSTSTPFEYAAFGSWSAQNNLKIGMGYMIHYGSTTGNDGLVSGVRFKTLSNVRIHNGWNAVGATSFTTCVSDVFFTGVNGGPVPALISEVFDFTATKGYNTVAYMHPGHGYFLRVNDEGFYNINPVSGCKTSATSDADVKGSLVSLTVRDASQSGQELFFGNTKENDAKYELPPIVRDFDARFAENNGYVSTKSESHTVNIASQNYPVAMNFANANGTVEVRDQLGNLIGATEGNGTVVIRDANVKTVIVSYKQNANADVNGFSLNTNAPNPFSAMTKIGYTVPAETFVTITVTNALGQNVETIVNSVVAAGSHSVDFDGSRFANGTYFYTIRAGNFVKTISMTIQK